MKLEMTVCLRKGFAINSYDEFKAELVSFEATGTLRVHLIPTSARNMALIRHAI